ncbi:diguanylate cyclase [Thiorhodococcus fuscus]|uniref:Diguanylate cyclase n=1 Tax=Thiorhodococcus fuscus TaxID=527200 RepID=A0ABW4Y624_9GAMM
MNNLKRSTHLSPGLRRGWLDIACVASVALLVAPELRALDEIRLQLKWRHQFQFAGYYVALDRGYYRDAGLEVTLVEAQPDTDVVAEVVSGRAEFGTGTSELLLARQTQPIVALAPIYQHSPFALAVRADRASNLHELVGQPIMLEPGAAEIIALFQQEGVSIDQLDIRPHTQRIDDLTSGRIAAMSVYSTTEPYQLRRLGFNYNLFSARAGGIDFYGDILFTTEDQTRRHPKRVRAFLDASLAGWREALKHSETAIDLIMARYNSQGRDRDAYRFEAEESRRLMRPDLIDVGHSNPGRWRHIADTYAELGMLPRNVSLDRFLYDSNRPRLDPRFMTALAGSLTLLLLLSALTWKIVRLNRRLASEIVERDRINRHLREHNALFHLITENSSDVIWILDIARRRFEYVSPSVTSMRGFSPQEVMAEPIEASMTVESWGRIAHLIDGEQAGMNSGFAPQVTEIEQPLKQGGTVHAEVVTTPVLDEAGHPVKLLGITRDTTRRKTLEAELRTRIAAIEAAGDAIAITDAQGRLLYANPAFARQTGYTLSELKGVHTRAFKSGLHDADFYADLWQTVLGGRIWRGEMINKRKGGSLYEEEMTIAPVMNVKGEVDCFVAIKRDVSERRSMERALKQANRQLSENLARIRLLQKELAEQTIRDPLTGLHNRRYLDETLPREFARARHEGYVLTAAMVDVDHFKRINDTWGHPAGDALLKALAALLQKRFREGDIVCRYGGEEFLVLLPHASIETCLPRADWLRQAFGNLRMIYQDVEIRATLSIGLASYPEYASSPQELIQMADAALYRAKHHGRNRIEVISSEA